MAICVNLQSDFATQRANQKFCDFVNFIYSCKTSLVSEQNPSYLCNLWENKINFSKEK